MSALPESLRDRLDHQRGILARLREASVRSATPYLAHMRLDTGARHLDVLLGTTSVVLPGLSIIDWANAPLAELFFTCEEDDEYELDLGDRLLSGRLLEKNLVGFNRGELSLLECDAGTLFRNDEMDGPAESWSFQPAPEGRGALSATVIPPRASSARKPFRSPLEVELDPAQREIVELPSHTSVLILGEAGFGKTTVALHRLATWKERVGPRLKAAVIVPTEGLRRLTELMLERRGILGVDVWTYDRFAAKTARRIFKDLPKRESVGATSAVQRLKRHPATRQVLQSYLQKFARPARDEDRARRVTARASRFDLEHFFGDSEWMSRIVEQAPGVLYPAVIEDVTEHTRIQFLHTTEAEHAHFDDDRLVTVDGRRIDEGTPTEDANSIDVEDYAVLFELERLRAVAEDEEPASIASYDLLVVDEAQEFAPLELALMGRALRPGGALIVAGDAAQQVDPTAFFDGWDGVLRELGKPGATQRTLAVNYRCPPDVTRLARAIVERTDVQDRALTPTSTEAAEEPSHITWLMCPSSFHVAYRLTRELTALLQADPNSSIALICRSPESARSWLRALRHGVTAHLALNGDFEFRPGVLVTSVYEVKGLEFDYVLLPDASASTYPVTTESRRALYVAVTRATHRLALVTNGLWSPLLQGWPVPAGGLQQVRESTPMASV